MVRRLGIAVPGAPPPWAARPSTLPDHARIIPPHNGADSLRSAQPKGLSNSVLGKRTDRTRVLVGVDIRHC